jgi:glycosyltransferase involved in cell wall biosynthesis
VGDDSRLRIALVSPPWYPVPPNGYGGTELVVYLLAEELGNHGHDVTVFGQEGGRGAFELVALSPRSWIEDLGQREQLAREATYLRRVYEEIKRRPFDVIHEHSGHTGLLIATLLDLQPALVATIHGDLTPADLEFLQSVDTRVDLVALSRAQQGVAGVRWAAVVGNAVDTAELDFRARPDDYLLELARVCPDKGQDTAIEVARRAGRRLVLAGKVGEGAEDWFRERIQPQLGGGVEWLENVSGRDKARLLAGAAAMLFPIRWAEPFGLAMAEAMVSGTPVIATPRGAAAEVVEAGLTGWFGEDVDELVAAVERLGELDRARCCEHARDRFSPRRMAEGYEEVYRTAVRRQRDRAWA